MIFRYQSANEGLLDQSIDLMGGTIKLLLVSSAYSPNQFADKFVTAVSGILARTAALSGKSVAGGVFDAADLILTSVPMGTDIHAIVIYQDYGSDAASRLIMYLDSATVLPFTPTGHDIPLAWDNGPNKIFRL